MATIKDVAKRAGVSTSTVSHVLNKTRFVSNDMMAMGVINAAHKKAYLFPMIFPSSVTMTSNWLNT